MISHSSHVQLAGMLESKQVMGQGVCRWEMWGGMTLAAQAVLSWEVVMSAEQLWGGSLC